MDPLTIAKLDIPRMLEDGYNPLLSELVENMDKSFYRVVISVRPKFSTR